MMSKSTHFTNFAINHRSDFVIQHFSRKVQYSSVRTKKYEEIFWNIFDMEIKFSKILYWNFFQKNFIDGNTEVYPKSLQLVVEKLLAPIPMNYPAHKASKTSTSMAFRRELNSLLTNLKQTVCKRMQNALTVTIHICINFIFTAILFYPMHQTK